MDTTTRNKIFLENEDLIKRVMNHNYPLLKAMRLEWDDVYQELAVAALNAINTFDPLRSSEIRAHIWVRLQYAILDIKRRHKTCGMTGTAVPQPQIYSVELSEEMGYPLPAPSCEGEDAIRNRRLHQVLAQLEPGEREVVILYLEGVRPKRRARKRDFNSALEKLRGFYLDLAAQLVMGGAI